MLPWIMGKENIKEQKEQKKSFNNRRITKISRQLRSVSNLEDHYTYRATTYPSEHSTPNQEHGLPTPISSIQLDKAPCGSLVTLSLNLSKATPKHTNFMKKKKESSKIQKLKT